MNCDLCEQGQFHVCYPKVPTAGTPPRIIARIDLTDETSDDEAITTAVNKINSTWAPVKPTHTNVMLWVDAVRKDLFNAQKHTRSGKKY